VDCDGEEVAGVGIGVDGSCAAVSDETCDVATASLLGCRGVPGAAYELLLLASMRALFLGAMATLEVMS
jgi:hypothetical protein